MPQIPTRISPMEIVMIRLKENFKIKMVIAVIEMVLISIKNNFPFGNIPKAAPTLVTCVIYTNLSIIGILLFKGIFCLMSHFEHWSIITIINAKIKTEIFLISIIFTFHC
jgi:hypothetical protein